MKHFDSKKITEWLKNKYIITLVVFFVWVMFFDKTNVKSWIGESIKSNRLENEKEGYKRDIIRIDKQLNLLQSNNDSLEKFAREHFFMKRPNEEIFLIEE